MEGLPGLPKPLCEFLGMRERDLRAEGLFVAEGRLLVERAIASGLSVLAVAADSSAAAEARALASGSIPAYECPKDVLDSVAGFPFHRGMLAIARRPPLTRSGDLNLAVRAPEGPILVLPEITDPYACLEKHGMSVTRLTQEQISQFHAATKAVRDDWAAKIGPDLVKAAEQDMAAAK